PPRALRNAQNFLKRVNNVRFPHINTVNEITLIHASTFEFHFELVLKIPGCYVIQLARIFRAILTTENCWKGSRFRSNFFSGRWKILFQPENSKTRKLN